MLVQSDKWGSCVGLPLKNLASMAVPLAGAALVAYGAAALNSSILFEDNEVKLDRLGGPGWFSGGFQAARQSRDLNWRNTPTARLSLQPPRGVSRFR